ncbi:hypothetical protein BV25DRAFT_1470006 [Artomyces pyxidatus]|uniref:Uncharacterized protein n=1 Tax=Artomyces pyxidatus TaxID=48021 RepID=A0ACB8SLK8_9AGAM|nr:hypothetical protein BV25DRAFT_1470006 [Artomyces pyxidatus]
MVNWHDPALVLKDYLAVIKLDHVLGGIYIWEYATSLDYEWSVLTAKRPYRWTFAVYALCRLAALAAWATLFAGLDAPARIHCQAWDAAFYVCAYTSLAAASFIILLRIVAVWDRSAPATALAAAAWLASIALNVRGIALGRSHLDPSTGACLNTDTQRALANAAGILVSDLVLLALMLAGLARSRDARMFGISKLLFHQGIAWLALAAVAEIPTVVFVALNLNDAWNLMFQPVELLILVVGATRMYRALTDYGAVTEFSTGRSHPHGAHARTLESHVRFRRPDDSAASGTAVIRMDAFRDARAQSVSVSTSDPRGRPEDKV